MNISDMNIIKKYIIRPVGGLIVLLYSLSVHGQDDSVKTLVSKLNRYYNTTLQEKLFIHTDQSLYLTGETLWFKIYNVDATLHKPLNVSKVAYIEILDKERVAIVQEKVSIDGNGSGSVF